MMCNINLLIAHLSRYICDGFSFNSALLDDVDNRNRLKSAVFPDKFIPREVAFFKDVMYIIFKSHLHCLLFELCICVFLRDAIMIGDTVCTSCNKYFDIAVKSPWGLLQSEDKECS